MTLLAIISHLFKPGSRIARRWYWFGFPGIVVLVFLLSPVAQTAGGRWATIFFFLPFYWSAFCLMSQRCHDTGRSAAWLLLLAVPIIGLIWCVVVLGFRRGSPGANRYGAPINSEYHVMIWVIGLSTSVEYGLKGLYETVIGQFSEAVAGTPDTAEDRLSARTAQRYVDFIKVHAWYDFDFLTPLRSLWTETGLWGDQPLRKWERKYFLTSEYLAKAAYGWALGKATHASYDMPVEQTDVIVDGLPATLPDGTQLMRQGANGSLLALPRYQAFTGAAQSLAMQGLNFREIAGNRGQILVSVVAASDFHPGPGGQLLYSQPILTRPGRTRFAIVYDVANLAALLRGLAKASIPVEHIYDF